MEQSGGTNVWGLPGCCVHVINVWAVFVSPHSNCCIAALIQADSTVSSVATWVTHADSSIWVCIWSELVSSALCVKILDQSSWFRVSCRSSSCENCLPGPGSWWSRTCASRSLERARDLCFAFVQSESQHQYVASACCKVESLCKYYLSEFFDILNSKDQRDELMHAIQVVVLYNTSMKTLTNCFHFLGATHTTVPASHNSPAFHKSNSKEVAREGKTLKKAN